MPSDEQRKEIQTYLRTGKFRDQQRSAVAPVIAVVAIAGWFLTVILGSSFCESKAQAAAERERNRLTTTMDYYRMELAIAEWGLLEAERDVEMAISARDRVAAGIERLRELIEQSAPPATQ